MAAAAAHAAVGRMPFTWSMAGAFVLANDPLQGTPAALLGDHLSYLGNYGMNGCANNAAPHGCAANGCNYPGGNDPAEILGYADLATWVSATQAAGLYAGLWGVTYDNVEAEAACMAEVLRTLDAAHGVRADFLLVDGEKSFETNQNYSARFVRTLNGALPYELHKAYTPECHTAVPMAPWLEGNFTSIMPMAYWNADGVDPAWCLQWLLANGVPLPRAQVMWDGYTHGTPHSWSAYAADMALVKGARGFSVWRTLNEAEWGELKQVMENTTIAVW